MAKFKDPLTSWLGIPTNSGRHQTLFALAARLAEEGYEEDDVREMLRNACDESSSRQIADREVDDAVRDGFAKARGEVVDSSPTWPGMNEHALRRVIKSVDSPLDLQPLELRARDVVPVLYQPDEILYVGSGVSGGHRVQVKDWSVRDDQQEFITPNPYERWQGTNLQGETTTGNCKDGIKCRRFLIVEFDLAPDGLPFSRGAQAKILTYLAATAPLVMAVDSGGKSIHGWFGCPSNPVEWFSKAVELGADPALWRIQQLTRLPGGLRQDGNRQSILYWGLGDESGKH